MSVVIPTYNAGKYVCQAVDSVLAQTYPDVECIVLDDGSTDDTRSRLEPYSDRIIYVHQENRGRAAARNAGIVQATGDYIALLDADDYWRPDKLGRQVALLDSDASLGAVGCGAHQVTEDRVFVRELSAAPAPKLPSGDEGFAQLLTLDYGIAAPLSTLVIRTECLKSVGGFDETINTMEEWDLLLRMIHSWSIGCVLEPLAFYRGYGFHVPSKVAPRRRQDKYLEVVTRAFARLQDPSRYAALQAKALGLGHLRGALIDYAVGNALEGAIRLEEAWHCAPELFSSATPRFREVAAYFAAYLYDTVTPLHESLAFVESLFANLPAPLASLVSLRASTRALACTIQAFDCHNRNDRAGLRAVGWKALTTDRETFRNRGLVSIFIESLIGARSAKQIRRVVCGMRRRVVRPDD